MVSIIYKWLIVFALAGVNNLHHPIFVSVTEIEHNAANNSLEISCKVFTDDLETALRKKHNGKVDLLDRKFKPAMNPLVNEYIQRHLVIIADDKTVPMQFLGFEQQEEGIICYYEIKPVSGVKKIDVINNILYEYKTQQMGIIHVTVKGERKSRLLNNPEEKASFRF